MQDLSRNAKQAIVEKALSRDGRTLSEIAKAHNIGRSTLSKWIKCYRQNGIIGQDKRNMGYELTMAERFKHLIATASLDETEIGSYCREQGLYSFQLKQWKEAFMSQDSEKEDEKLVELKRLQEENKKLKQELRRKDNALAEASALLILKKKAALIWGEVEDD